MTALPAPEHLAQLLAEDGVAVSGAGEGDAAFESALQAAVAETGGEGGGLGLIVIDHTPDDLAHLRNIAEDVLAVRGADGPLASEVPATVIVRSPEGVAAASDSHPPAVVSQAATAMAVELDYPASVAAFARSLDDAAVIPGPLAAGVGILLAAALALTAGCEARRAGRRK